MLVCLDAFTFSFFNIYHKYALAKCYVRDDDTSDDKHDDATEYK